MEIVLLLDVIGDGIWWCWRLSAEKEQNDSDRRNINEQNKRDTIIIIQVAKTYGSGTCNYINYVFFSEWLYSPVRQKHYQPILHVKWIKYTCKDVHTCTHYIIVYYATMATIWCIFCLYNSSNIQLWNHIYLTCPAIIIIKPPNHDGWIHAYYNNYFYIVYYSLLPCCCHVWSCTGL